MEEKKHKLGVSALVLVIGGLVCKCLGALFRLPLTNLLGIEGIGVFQLIMSLYSFSLVVTCGGVASSLSKLISSARARGEHAKISTYLQRSIFLGRFGTIFDNNKEMLESVFPAIVYGTILMTTNALPYMKDSKDIVKIVNIISISGLRGFKFESLYCAAKAAQEGYSQVLRAELFGTNIKVVNVYPGGIDTDFWKNNRNYVSEEVQKTFAKPAEVAKTIVDSLYDKKSLVMKDLVFEQTHMNLQ